MPTLQIPYLPYQNGQEADGTQVTGSFQAVQTVVNGIDYANIGPNGIYASQLEPTTAAQAKFGGNLGYFFSPNNPAQVPLTAQGTANQTADLFDCLQGGTKVAWVDSAGTIHCPSLVFTGGGWQGNFAVTGNISATGNVSAGGSVLVGTPNAATTAMEFGNTSTATGSTHQTIIASGQAAVSGVNSQLMAVGDFGAGWDLALDQAGNFGVLGGVYAARYVVGNTTLQDNTGNGFQVSGANNSSFTTMRVQGLRPGVELVPTGTGGHSWYFLAGDSGGFTPGTCLLFDGTAGTAALVAFPDGSVSTNTGYYFGGTQAYGWINGVSNDIYLASSTGTTGGTIHFRTAGYSNADRFSVDSNGTLNAIGGAYFGTATTSQAAYVGRGGGWNGLLGVTIGPSGGVPNGNFHMNYGTVAASSSSTTVGLSGNAVFGTIQQVLVTDGATGAVATVTNITGSSFTFTSVNGRTYTYSAWGW